MYPAQSPQSVRLYCEGLVCVTSAQCLKEMKSDYSGIWVLGYFLIYNKEQEGNPKLSVSCQAMDWSYRILMAIVGKEKLVCFNTSGSLSSLWSSAISNGFMPQAVVCFVNLRDVEITKCPFLECGWIRSKRYYRTLTLFCGNKSKRSHSVVVMRNNVEYNPGIPSQPLRVQDKE